MVILTGVMAFVIMVAFVFSRYFSHRTLMVNKVTLKGFEVAINGFHTEYKRLPSAFQSANSETIPIRSEGSLVKCIMAEDLADNPRRIRFFEPPMSRNGTNGLLPNSEKAIIVDSWGEPYYLLADADSDGQTPNPETSPAKAPHEILARVLIYSSGPDKNSKTWKDNIKSWD